MGLSFLAADRSPGPSFAPTSCSSTSMACYRGLCLPVNYQLIQFPFLRSKVAQPSYTRRVAATDLLRNAGVEIGVGQWRSSCGRAISTEAKWQPWMFPISSDVSLESFRVVARIRGAKMFNGEGHCGNYDRNGRTSKIFRGRRKGGGIGRRGSRENVGPSARRSLQEFDIEEGEKKSFSSNGWERERFHSFGSGKDLESSRRGVKGVGRGSLSGVRGKRRSFRPSIERLLDEFGTEDEQKGFYSSDSGVKEGFRSASDEKKLAYFSNGERRGEERGEDSGNSTLRDQFRNSDVEGNGDSFRANNSGVKGGRGRLRESLGYRWRENVSRSPSPHYKDFNAEFSAAECWNSTEEVRGVRGNYGCSRRGRGALGGRGSSFKGGRSLSDFKGNRFSKDGRMQDSGERFGVNAPRSSRRGQLSVGEEEWQRKDKGKKTRTNFLRDYEDSRGRSPGERGRGCQDVNKNNGGESEGGDVGGVEVWRVKKIGWLCKEIPALRAAGIVTMLNSQKKWIKAVDAKEVMETLMRRNEILRAFRVLKWTMQQPWYQNDFNLNTKMANILGTKGKLTRMRELFDTIIATGAVPDLSTYIILVKADIRDGSKESLDHAFAIYNQMEQLGGYTHPATLAYTLFQAFTDRKGATHIRNLHKADALFENMKKKSALWWMGLNTTQWTAIFSGLIHMHSFQGNVARVHELVADMKEAALPLSRDVYNALIRVRAKDGDFTEAENVFRDLLSAGHQPDWRSYVTLIETYGAGGLPEKVQGTFDKMVAEGIHINLSVYQALIEAMVKVGSLEGALFALGKAEEKFSFVLHKSYNLLMELYRSKEMLLEIEVVFERMKEKKCRPNFEAYNNLIESYILRGRLDKAEAVYEDMNNEGFLPNTQTYCLMIEAFSRAERHERVKDMYAHLIGRKMVLPVETMIHVAEVIGEKKLAEREKQEIVNLKLVPKQRQILVGVLLGGAQMISHDCNRTHGVCFKLTDATEAGQILVNHLHDTFVDWSQQAPRMEVDDDLGKTYHFSTVSHGSLQFYAHQYRPDGQAVIPRLIHRWLDPLSLAYWYMYGGEKCSETRGINLNACQYTSKELTLVVKTLKVRTADCFLRKRRSGNVLCLTGDSAGWMWKLMEPHILDEMKDLLRPDNSAVMDGTRVIDDAGVFDESELRVMNGEDLAKEDSFVRTAIGVTHNDDSDSDEATFFLP